MAALQGAVAPVLDVNVGFLVQFADGGGRDLAAPQCLVDILVALFVHLNRPEADIASLGKLRLRAAVELADALEIWQSALCRWSQREH